MVSTLVKNFYVTLLILTILTFSCREDIVEPDTYVGTINEPVQINERNSYTFIIHAQNMSVNVINNTYVTSFTSKISISIVDHSSGFVSISVIDGDDNSRFSYFGDEEERLFSKSLIGYIPARIRISTTNFSGKLKVEVRKTN